VSAPNYQTGPGGVAVRPTVAVGTLWAGGFATAVVAGLAYAVGIVIVRVICDASIMGLATLLATVLPFAQEAPLSSQVATAIINLVVGVTITSLVRGVAARDVRPAAGHTAVLSSRVAWRVRWWRPRRCHPALR
jgi:hypothetical protein